MALNNVKSYMKAVSAAFVEMKTKFKKKVQQRDQRVLENQINRFVEKVKPVDFLPKLEEVVLVHLGMQGFRFNSLKYLTITMFLFFVAEYKASAAFFEVMESELKSKTPIRFTVDRYDDEDCVHVTTIENLKMH